MVAFSTVPAAGCDAFDGGAVGGVVRIQGGTADAVIGQVVGVARHARRGQYGDHELRTTVEPARDGGVRLTAARRRRGLAALSAA
jgi:hypothetical protein